MIRKIKKFLLKFDLIENFLAKKDARNRVNVIKNYILPDGVGIEIGVYKGVFSRELLVTLSPVKFTMVDMWYLQGRWEWATGDKCSVTGFLSAVNRVKFWLRSGVAHIVVENDTSFLRRMGDSTLDWAYLDSSHQFDHTCEELFLLHNKVRNHGIICGDDWSDDPSHKDHGVCRAVDQYLRQAESKLLYADSRSRQWVIRVRK